MTDFTKEERAFLRALANLYAPQNSDAGEAARAVLDAKTKTPPGHGWMYGIMITEKMKHAGQEAGREGRDVDEVFRRMCAAGGIEVVRTL